ncbi:cytochrome P450 9c1-like [Teleopsis dalmanni]|uniref:cytochrome P450 9c1-like n=1 Tax=Teleopsis dalmanni TaxID=139649 RepID=UPI0018CE38A8|nr:cytochrome P450 9c1-like [Teleopsis dalmanni]
MGLIVGLLLGSILAYVCYKWSTAKFKILSERGIPHDEPTPLLGNIKWSILSGKDSFMRASVEKYKKYKHNKVYGAYNFRDPVIFVSDIELIKKIGIKDFDNFANHKATFNEVRDNILAKSLVKLQNQKWKEMRTTLTPTFTGSKMRQMFELINECSIEGVSFLQSELKAAGINELDIEMKDYFTRYSNDVIASAAFGIKVNSFVNKTNEFYEVGRTFTRSVGLIMVKAFLIKVVPTITRLLHIKLLNETLLNYFRSLVFDAIEYRKKNNIIRPDMIHLLTEAKKQFDASKQQRIADHAEFNDEDLLAQCLLFFLAGFETVSTCLCFTCYELLMNPDVQETLYEEILATEQDLNGSPLYYDALMNMRYMDMVVSESLRKWPPALATDRVCANDYNLTDNDGKLVLKLKKNDLIFIPIVGLHYDPEHFPEPEKFDPLRFSDANKKNINHLAYVPFGLGPRSCIGNRLALMEAKAMIYHLLLHFKIEPNEKTSTDMFNSIRGFQLKPKELFWMKFTPRNKN